MQAELNRQPFNRRVAMLENVWGKLSQISRKSVAVRKGVCAGKVRPFFSWSARSSRETSQVHVQ